MTHLLATAHAKTRPLPASGTNYREEPEEEGTRPPYFKPSVFHGFGSGPGSNILRYIYSFLPGR